MLTEDRKGLLIFENFREDKGLPKFRKENEELRKTLAYVKGWIRPDSEGSFDISSSWDEDEMLAGNGAVVIGMPVRRESLAVRPKPPAGLAAVWAAIVRVLFFWRSEDNPGNAEPSDPDETGDMSVEEFFSGVKNSAKELAVVEERARGYERRLRIAIRTGQKALYEKLIDGLHVHRTEAQLVAIGLPKYVDESKMVELVSASKRGLRLDWIRNFVRHIPDDVIDRKDRADDLGLFDNYAILHYDPKGKASEKTKAEKEAERDPILFGLVKGSRRLYFVGDWVDEYCDLTLDQFADMMGADAVGSLTAVDPYRDAPETAP